MKRREFLTAASVAGGGVAAAAPAAAQETATPTPTQTGGGDSGGGGGGFTWTVDMTDENVFIPEDLQVRPGDTVVWENVGSVGHTVTAYEDDIPEEAEFFASGGFDSEEAARNGYPDSGVIEGGESYEHTFSVEGTHEYFCIPHESIGMVGTIEVTPDAPTPTPEPAAGGAEVDDNPEHWGVPFQAHFVGLATALGVVASLVFTFYALKYGESPNTTGGND